jgi:methyl-accepting chemotaxis protein
MSLRNRIVCIGVALPLLFTLVLLVMFTLHSRKQAVDSLVQKARTVCSSAQSIRQTAEKNWDLGVITTEKLREWAESGHQDRLVSSVPIATAWQAARINGKKNNFEFRVPKFEPRNPVNQPNALESTALKEMQAKSLEEYYTIDAQTNTIHYFQSIRLTQSCMACHGDPSQSETLWGNDRGLDPLGGPMENWTVGEMHGAFEVV